MAQKNLQYGLYANYVDPGRRNTSCLLVSDKVSPKIDEWHALQGVRCLVTPGTEHRLIEMLEENTLLDAATILDDISQHFVVRLKKALGVEIQPRTGASRTTAWRKQKSQRSEKK